MAMPRYRIAHEDAQQLVEYSVDGTPPTDAFLRALIENDIEAALAARPSTKLSDLFHLGRIFIGEPGGLEGVSVPTGACGYRGVIEQRQLVHESVNANERSGSPEA